MNIREALATAAIVALGVVVAMLWSLAKTMTFLSDDWTLEEMFSNHNIRLALWLLLASFSALAIFKLLDKLCGDEKGEEKGDEKDNDQT